MDSELRAVAVPWFKSCGFTGTLPHFRRKSASFTDLLTFQFDRHGGGFVIEIARCPSDGIVTSWGKAIPASKATAWNVHPSCRLRIQAWDSAGTDGWFRFDRDTPEAITALAISKLNEGGLWERVSALSRKS
ncbi:DUF4304 domain-containing protein [Labrys sp. LIt4]|uniref:DUF4304 domain-containing protein n=1 Tax=Labrys sedimenti TaxID=3106036 RepID=UPI001AE0C596|nr:DUF4304 domain-containing protein [Labrys sp. LIt4]